MHIIVFEQNGSARQKIHGIHRYGRKVEVNQIYSINGNLPEKIDDPARYLPRDFSAELALDFLFHPDLSQYLIGHCVRKKIAIISSGKQQMKGAFTPFTCCGLGRHHLLGAYGEEFGFPEFEVELSGEQIADIKVVRGAPCGATWEVCERLIGQSVEQAYVTFPKEIQKLCFTSPMGLDPVTGKSSLHFAGYVHRIALEKAVDVAKKQNSTKESIVGNGFKLPDCRLDK